MAAIYLAGPWLHREVAKDLATKLEAKGHTITRKWWEFEGEEGELSETELEQQALHDFYGVMNCDLMVLLNSAKSEGKAVEQGIALTMERPIIAVGKLGEHSKNIFHHLPAAYHWVDTVEDALAAVDVFEAAGWGRLRGWD